MTDDRAHLERVAQAIWKADENAHEAGWFEVNPRWRDHYIRLALAALAAAEPTVPGATPVGEQ